MRVIKIAMLSCLAFLVASNAQAMDIDGFRSAKFGQKESQVMSAIQSDLKIAAGQVKKEVEPNAGVTVLTAEIKSFEPLNLPAEVGYVLGNKCQCLTQVIVSWKFPKGLDVAKRGEAMQGVAALAGHFAKGSWEKGETVTNRLMSKAKEGEDSAIVFFRGQNASGSAVTLLASPVKMVKQKDDKQTAAEMLAANIDDISLVSLSYEKDTKNPDIKKIDVSGF